MSTANRCASMSANGYPRLSPLFECAANCENTKSGSSRNVPTSARLHAQAPKWFRVDVGTFRDDPDFVFSHLAAHSKSGLSLGYPFALIEAHRLAVLIRQHREFLEDEILKECARLGMTVGEVAAGLTQMEGRRHGAFHEYLDRVARDLK